MRTKRVRGESRLASLLRAKNDATESIRKLEKQIDAASSEELGKDRILELSRRMSRKEIAVELTLPKHIVNEYLKGRITEHDQAKLRLKWERREELLPKVCKLREEGMTFRDISNHLGIGISKVRDLFQMAERRARIRNQQTEKGLEPAAKSLLKW